MLKLVCKKLKKDQHAAIRWPTEDEKQEWASMVNAREPSVDNIIGFVDGISLKLAYMLQF